MRLDPTTRCQGCRDGNALAFEIAMAFQPIVDIRTGLPFAYEALVRGAGGEGAGWVLGQVTEANRYAFDQRCRVAAIEGAVAAGVLDTDARLSVNFLPGAVYSPKACIQLTLATAARVGFPTDRLIFEFTEGEHMSDPSHVAGIVAAYKQMGFGVAIDDFGAGFSGLGLLSRFTPEIVKLDMELIRDCDKSPARAAVLMGTVRLIEALGMTIVGEGVETEGEARVLADLGVYLQQGFLYAKPAFRALPPLAMPLALAA